jgi:predicted DNA-binding transcriptional regulator YafY
VAEETWHRSQQTEELPDGRILFKLHVVITPEFVNWLMYYGSKVEVLEPKSLREQVAAEQHKAADIQNGCG